MQSNKKTRKYGIFFLFFLLFAATAAMTGLAGFFYRISMMELLHNLIITCIGAGAVIYLFAYSKLRGELDYDNGEHPGRFLIVFLVVLFIALVLVLIPSMVWPYLPLFIALSLFSNSKVGMVSGGLCLMLTVSLGGLHTLGDFFVYFICGCAGIVLFQGLDETYKVTARTFISLLLLMAGLCAQYVLLVNEVFSLQLFLLPVINIAVSLLLLMAILKGFSSTVILHYRLRYLELNDPQCPLLVSLKEKQKEEYFRAVHTAYFCDRIAKRLSLDADAAKGGGFYHRIGILKGENSWDNINEICKEYRFPPGIRELLKEYADQEEPIHSKEAAVLLFSETVIATVRSLFLKEPEVKPDYQLLIEAVFKRNTARGLLAASDLSLRELGEIKTIFLEEKLYYDFLR